MQETKPEDYKPKAKVTKTDPRLKSLVETTFEANGKNYAASAVVKFVGPAVEQLPFLTNLRVNGAEASEASHSPELIAAAEGAVVHALIKRFDDEAKAELEAELAEKEAKASDANPALDAAVAEQDAAAKQPAENAAKAPAASSGA